MFYLRDSLAVSKDDVIEGTISIQPNKTNERDLDIEIEYGMKGEIMTVEGELMQYKMC